MARKIKLTESGELLEGGTITMIETSPDCFVFDSCDGDMCIGLFPGQATERDLRDIIEEDNENRQAEEGLRNGYNTGHSTFRVEDC